MSRCRWSPLLLLLGILAGTSANFAQDTPVGRDSAATRSDNAAQQRSMQAGDSQSAPATDILDTEHSVTDALEIVPFTSKILHNTRMLRILIPGNYWSPHNRTRRYPVLYLQDGQNLFEKATSSSHIEWQVDETVDHLVGSFQIPPMFIVGIDSTADGHERALEYLPYPDTPSPDSPAAGEVRGKEYVQFLVTEVMPFIEKHYRIAAGAANTAIGGSSYGASISLYAGLHHPGTFGKLLIESPTLELGDGQLLHDAKEARALPGRMYVGVGTAEGKDAEVSARLRREVESLQQILRTRGMGPTRLKVVVEEGAGHDETAWARRLPDALLFLYGQKCLGACR